MKTEIEEVSNLTPNQKARLFDLMVEAQKCQTTERLFNTATALFPSSEAEFFIIRGGRHIAVHNKTSNERILLIVEEKGAS